MPSSSITETSAQTVNRLSLYLRCLRQLREGRIERVSSQELARRFDLSATQIRKDLAQFGEFGIRGVGYDVSQLIDHLRTLLGLDRAHKMVIVGIGNLGLALAKYPGFNSTSFQVVAGVDIDHAKVGRKAGAFTIRHAGELGAVVRASGAEIGVLTVPEAAAQGNYDGLVRAGVRAVLNFTRARLREVPEVPLKEVDLRVYLEEMAFFLRR